MARRDMEDIVAEAQKRRARFLREWEKAKAKGMTLVKFGRLNGMTGERMGQHIKKARLEAQG
jgi:hypothetical protein